MQHALVCRATVLLVDEIDLNHVVLQHVALVMALLLLLLYTFLEKCLFQELANSLLLHIGDAGSITR